MKLCRKGLAIRPRVCAYCRYKCRLKQEIGRIAKRIIHLREKKPNRFGWTFYGAGDEDRTRYLHLGKVALYRMSYPRGTR